VKFEIRLILSVVILSVALLLQTAEAQAEPALTQARWSEPALESRLSDRLARPSVRVRASAARASRSSFVRPASVDPVSSTEIPKVASPRDIPQLDSATRNSSGEWISTIAVSAEIRPELSRWELSLAPSIATGMLDGLEFLIDYPFG
jgi:hypothetical protein